MPDKPEDLEKKAQDNIGEGEHSCFFCHKVIIKFKYNTVTGEIIDILNPPEGTYAGKPRKQGVFCNKKEEELFVTYGLTAGPETSTDPIDEYENSHQHQKNLQNQEDNKNKEYKPKPF